MAKNQNLALNPSKINGQCGRLLCCLGYEDEVYTEKRVGLPNIGDVIKTEKGKGTVVSLDILKRTYQVDVPEEGRSAWHLRTPRGRAVGAVRMPYGDASGTYRRVRIPGPEAESEQYFGPDRARICAGSRGPAASGTDPDAGQLCLVGDRCTDQGLEGASGHHAARIRQCIQGRHV